MNRKTFKDRRSSNEERKVNNLYGRYICLTTGAVPAFSLWNGGG